MVPCAPSADFPRSRPARSTKARMAASSRPRRPRRFVRTGANPRRNSAERTPLAAAIPTIGPNARHSPNASPQGIPRRLLRLPPFVRMRTAHRPQGVHPPPVTTPAICLNARSAPTRGRQASSAGLGDPAADLPEPMDTPPEESRKASTHRLPPPRQFVRTRSEPRQAPRTVQRRGAAPEVPPALRPAGQGMICPNGRPVTDGRLANPVRSGRKQPQRVSARVVSPVFHPHSFEVRRAGMASTLFGTGNAADDDQPRDEGLPEPPPAEGPGLFGGGEGDAAAAPPAARGPAAARPPARPIACSPANTAPRPSPS